MGTQRRLRYSGAEGDDVPGSAIELTSIRFCLTQTPAGWQVLPDLVGRVRRAEWVTVSGLDRLGRPITVEGENLLARVLQHEIVHLDGILSFAGSEDPTRLRKVSELSTAATKATAHL
jgi:hypothetical protein